MARSVWNEISRLCLLPEHRTLPRQKSNDRRVTQFLLQKGPYAIVGRGAGETLYEEPQTHFEALVWPNTNKKSYVQAMDEYLHEWNELTESLPESEMPKDRDLVAVMMKAIRPRKLAKII